MLRGVVLFCVAVLFGVSGAVAVVFWAWPCGDADGPVAAAPPDVACRDILGSWDLYLDSDGTALEAGAYGTGGRVVFAADGDGRFMNMADDNRYWTGTKDCVRTGRGYELQLEDMTFTFEMASDGTLRQVGGGPMSVVLRRVGTGCFG